jgi:hypothetical protein
MLREKPIRIVALPIVIVCVLLPIPHQLLFAAPVPPELVVNHETKECAEFFGGDECTYCYPPEGWESLGESYEVECPAGYTLIDDLDVECRASKGEFCCSEGHSGAPGDCEDMVLHKRRKQCAFVDDIHTAVLPKGWEAKPESMSPDRWSCPTEYEWVEDLDTEPDVAPNPTATVAGKEEDNGSGDGGLPCLNVALLAPVALGVWLSTSRQRRT